MTFVPMIEVVPAVNQVEVHPYYSQPALRAEHARLGIATQVWSPLGGVYVYGAERAGREGRSALADPVITGIAERRGRTPAQVILRWHIDGGRSAEPPPDIASRPSAMLTPVPISARMMIIVSRSIVFVPQSAVPRNI